MDPNATWRRIKDGEEVKEHVLALKEWLDKGGFVPTEADFSMVEFLILVEHYNDSSRMGE